MKDTFVPEARLNMTLTVAQTEIERLAAANALLLVLRAAAVDVIAYHGTAASSKMVALGLAVDAFNLARDNEND